MKQLERLSCDNGRVVDFDISSDERTVNIVDGCDVYFSEAFDKKEFGELLDELADIYNRMKD